MSMFDTTLVQHVCFSSTGAIIGIGIAGSMLLLNFSRLHE